MSEQIVVNIRARNGNYYRGHKHVDGGLGCWSSDRKKAMTFTLDQAKCFVKLYLGDCDIVFAIRGLPIWNPEYARELEHWSKL